MNFRQREIFGSDYINFIKNTFNFRIFRSIVMMRGVDVGDGGDEPDVDDGGDGGDRGALDDDLQGSIILLLPPLRGGGKEIKNQKSGKRIKNL